MRRGVEASLANLQLSDETYYLDPEGRWVVSAQSTHYRNSRTEVETLLRQRMQGLRSVSFQLPCEEDVLASAFVDKPLCVARQLAELLQQFCVWRDAPMRFLSSQGDVVDSYDPALKRHRTVCFLCFNGHCYMYRCVKRVLERDAWRTLYRGEARQELPPIVEWKRFDPALPLEPGLFWCEDLREARRDLMAAGESPKVTLSSPSQYSGLRLRCGMRIRELPEEHELLRRWCEGLDQEYRGQRLAGLAHEVFLKLLKAKREVPTAAQRQEVLAVQQGLCALCGCTVTQSACELDHIVPCGSSSQTACSGCRRSALTATARRRSGNPRSPRVWRAASARGLWRPTCAVRSGPGEPPREALPGVDVVRSRRNLLANAPFPLPILCPADGVEPVEPGRLPDLGYVEGCRDARQAALQLLPFVGFGWYPKVSIDAMLETGVCRWDHIPLGIYARPRPAGPGAHGRCVARGRGAHGQALGERDDRAMGAPRGRDLLRAQQQLPAGRPRRRLHAKLLLRGGQRLGLRVHTAPANQWNVSPHPRWASSTAWWPRPGGCWRRPHGT